MGERRTWTETEVAEAAQMRLAGATFSAIARKQGRAAGGVQRKLEALKRKRRAWRPWTDDLRQKARDLRAAGHNDTEVCRLLGRPRFTLSQQIGPDPRKIAATVALKPGIAEVRGSCNRILARDTLRTAWNDFALPPGNPVTWGAISAEKFCHV